MSEADHLYSILSTTRTIRRISERPIEDDVLQRILQAAIWAPSGGNRQPWRIIAIKNREIKQKLSDIYSKRWDEYVEYNMLRLEGKPEHVVEATRKGFAIGTHLSRTLADVPVVAMFVHDPREIFVTDDKLTRTSVVGGASLYPAVQNLLIAARAEGLGGVLTTLISANENEVREILKLPEPWGVYAMVPLGYPMGSHGKLRRLPFERIIKFDTWSD